MTDLTRLVARNLIAGGAFAVGMAVFIDLYDRLIRWTKNP